MAEASERFIARRKLTRFWSCSAIDWATSFASSSGRLISLMLMWTLFRSHAGLADDDSGTRGEDVHGDPLLVLADQDVGQPGVGQLLVDVLADLDVLEQVAGEVLRAGEPVRLPVVDDADAQTAW